MDQDYNSLPMILTHKDVIAFLKMPQTHWIGLMKTLEKHYKEHYNSAFIEIGRKAMIAGENFILEKILREEKLTELTDECLNDEVVKVRDKFLIGNVDIINNFPNVYNFVKMEKLTSMITDEIKAGIEFVVIGILEIKLGGIYG